LSFPLTISHTRQELTVAETRIANPVLWRIGQLHDVGWATGPAFRPISGSITVY